MKYYTIAIDGPAAAGKSTVAKRVASTLRFTYIDTGAMYRAVTLYCFWKGVDPKVEADVLPLIPEIHIHLLPDNTVLLNEKDVTKEIRSIEVAAHVSYIASYKEVRLFLVEQQRKLAKRCSVVMDGRDIGSYVLPHADVKIFQIASVETRAIRRYQENKEKGLDCTLKEVEEELKMRDYIDSNRSFAPLKKAEDAIELDTSQLTIEQAVQSILDIISKKIGDVHA